MTIWGNPRREKSKQAKTRHSESVMLDVFFYGVGAGLDPTWFAESQPWCHEAEKIKGGFDAETIA